MNIYDTTNQLAKEIKESEEYINYKMAKQTLSLNHDLQEKIKKFDQMRYEVQIIAMQTGKQDEEKYKEMQELYMEIVQTEDGKKFIEAETKFNIVIADINKIIGEAIKDIMQ